AGSTRPASCEPRSCRSERRSTSRRPGWSARATRGSSARTPAAPGRADDRLLDADPRLVRIVRGRALVSRRRDQVQRELGGSALERSRLLHDAAAADALAGAGADAYDACVQPPGRRAARRVRPARKPSVDAAARLHTSLTKRSHVRLMSLDGARRPSRFGDAPIRRSRKGETCTDGYGFRSQCLWPEQAFSSQRVSRVQAPPLML